MSWKRAIAVLSIALVLPLVSCENDESESTTTSLRSTTTSSDGDTTTTTDRQEADELELAKRAVVMVAWAAEDQGTVRYTIGNYGFPYGASGSIITPDGLILTNAHVAKPDAPGQAVLYQDIAPQQPPELLVVRMVEEEDRPPVGRFLAEPMTVDGWLDLAVLRVTHHVEEQADGTLLVGAEVDRSGLDLPAIPVGDSDAIDAGDPLVVLGFPANGNETLSVTGNRVSGFNDDLKLGTRGWIKTDTKISGGNSGGMGLVDGRLIGVPTRGPELEEQGFNQLRPITLGSELIADAQAGESYVQATGVVFGTGEQSLELVKWATDFDEQTGCGTEETSGGYAEGTKRIVGQFAYDAMTDGEDILELWVRPEDRVSTWVYVWDWGNNGECFPVWFSDTNGLPDGEYTVALFAGPNLRRAGLAKVEVGVDPRETTRIVATALDRDTGQPITDARLGFLRPDVSLDEWRANPTEEAVLTAGRTGPDGTVDLGQLFERGVEYVAVGFADGYQPIRATYRVPADAGESIGVTFNFVAPTGS